MCSLICMCECVRILAGMYVFTYRCWFTDGAVTCFFFPQSLYDTSNHRYNTLCTCIYIHHHTNIIYYVVYPKICVSLSCIWLFVRTCTRARTLWLSTHHSLIHTQWNLNEVLSEYHVWNCWMKIFVYLITSQSSSGELFTICLSWFSNEIDVCMTLWTTVFWSLLKKSSNTSIFLKVNPWMIPNNGCPTDKVVPQFALSNTKSPPTYIFINIYVYIYTYTYVYTYHIYYELRSIVTRACLIDWCCSYYYIRNRLVHLNHCI